LGIAHEQEMLVSLAYEKEMLFKITYGQEVFVKLSDQKGMDVRHLMDRPHLYSYEVTC
jgi:hypothetical protein